MNLSPFSTSSKTGPTHSGGPMNHTPIWKGLLVLMVVGFSVLYAMPNLYEADPAVQISSVSKTVEMSEYQQHLALRKLEQQGVVVKSHEQVGSNWVVRLEHRAQQLTAKDILERTFLGDYVVALNLVDTTPEWLASMGASPMKLGLDLSGGVHFLLQVDTGKMVQKRMDTLLENVEKSLREAEVDNKDWNAEIREQGIQIRFGNAEVMNQGLKVLRSEMPELTQAEDIVLPTNTAYLVMTESRKKELENYAVNQNISALRSRINALGVAEPVVQRQGKNRIVVELPGVQDTAEAKKIIGQTANLEFRLGATRSTLASRKERFPMKQEPGQFVDLEKKVVVGGDCVEEVFPSLDQNSLPITVIHLNAACGRDLYRATAKRVGRMMGIVLSETRLKTRLAKDEQGNEVVEEYEVEEQQVISYANIKSALGSQFQIEGLSQSEAQTLSVLLRAGALAAPVYFVEERTVGPSMGAENIRAGWISAIVGFALVCAFMLFYYRLFGVAACAALTANLVIVVACMSMFGATLTMPGIAGIVLLVGMAVDANVLIFSRIKEEMKNGLSSARAINAGYDRAFVTILDSNLTTLIVAIILFAIGTGPVQGFAITLSIGILASMFTSITLTRVLVNAVYGGKKNPQSLSI